MFQFDLDNKRYHKVHFIGIGGVSMSGLAQLLHHYGFAISGSDRNESEATEKLKNIGINIYIGQKKENIKQPDLIIYTDAILPDNEELIAAKQYGAPCVSRGVFLGALMRNYTNSIAVSGSHGKSTTTSMISKILVNSAVKPTILLGGKLDEISGNVLCGEREYLLTEACEFKANILNYYPSMAIVLNIDADHLDFYKNLDHIVDTFIGYMKNLNENAKAIININDPNCLPLIEHVKGEVITFGINNPKADFNATNVAFDENNKPSFDLISKKYPKERFELNIIGRFNIYNATAAIIAALETGIPINIVKKNISSYKNLHRRMELIGKCNDANVITDYGHHPVEIKATLAALTENKHRRLICIFQPHTYSRTKKLMKEFSYAFHLADEVIITEIFAAREKFDPTVHSRDLVKALHDNGVKAQYLETFEEARDYVYSIVQPKDIILTTGCGNPDELAKMIVNDYENYKKNLER